MRLSHFQNLMQDEFGAAYSNILLADQVLTELGDKTGAEALAAGVDPREVWLALCKNNGVPKSRWHGFDKKKQSEHKDEK